MLVEPATTREPYAWSVFGHAVVRYTVYRWLGKEKKGSWKRPRIRRRAFLAEQRTPRDPRASVRRAAACIYHVCIANICTRHLGLHAEIRIGIRTRIRISHSRQSRGRKGLEPGVGMRAWRGRPAFARQNSTPQRLCGSKDHRIEAAPLPDGASRRTDL